MPVYPPGVAASVAAAAGLLLYSSGGIAAQKHQLPERSQPEKCLWVPKTLRIDDPLNTAGSPLYMCPDFVSAYISMNHRGIH